MVATAAGANAGEKAEKSKVGYWHLLLSQASHLSQCSEQTFIHLPGYCGQKKGIDLGQKTNLAEGFCQLSTRFSPRA